jgi:hypothetical protein
MQTSMINKHVARLYVIFFPASLLGAVKYLQLRNAKSVLLEAFLLL